MAQSKISTNINILLIGELDAGKSTFVNAFANYLAYRKFSTAETEGVRHLIPAQFSVPIGSIRQKIVQIGTHAYSNTTCSYVFPFNQIGIDYIRIINTPGIKGIKSIEQDNENFKHILGHLSQFQTLDAICFVFKPNNPGFRDIFNYCIRHLLPKLSKNSLQNIVFLFTDTRSTFYKLNDAVSDIKTVLKKIRDHPPYVQIKFEKDSNVFCFDNEAFRYLVAAKNGIDLGNKEIFERSWNHSVQECSRLINYIAGNGNFTTNITPHRLMDTLFLNRVYIMIVQLSKLLMELTKFQNFKIQRAMEMDKYLIMECEKEKAVIIKAIADCGYFLENNAIALFDDIFMSYVIPVIRAEQGCQSNAQLIEYCKRFMFKYNEQKQFLRSNMSTLPTDKFIFGSVQPLYNLPVAGKKIREIIERNPILQTDQYRSEKLLKIDKVRLKIKRSWGSTSSLESTSSQLYRQDLNIPKDRGYVQNNLQGKAANTPETRNYPNGRQDFLNYGHYSDREVNTNGEKREERLYQSETDINNITRDISQMNMGHNQTNPEIPRNLYSPHQYNQNFPPPTNYFHGEIPYKPSTSSYQAPYPKYPQNLEYFNHYNFSNYSPGVHGHYPIYNQGAHQNFQLHAGNQSYYQTARGYGYQESSDSRVETSLYPNTSDESLENNSNEAEDDNSSSSISTETDSQGSSNRRRK